jgi:hypothetical protein
MLPTYRHTFIKASLLTGYVLLISMLLTASACEEPIEAPTAVIQLVNTATIVAGNTVVLSGKLSKDHKNGTRNPLSYSWRFISAPNGSTTTLSDPTLDKTAFIADAYGNYVIGLIVSNGYLSSKEAKLTVTITACGNAAPTIDSVTPAPASANTGDLVTLTTTVSDTDNSTTCMLGQTLSVSSEFVGRPAGSNAMLAPAEGLLPAFTADVPGQYVVRTTVDDGTGFSSFVDTTVTVTTCGNAAPAINSVTPAPAAPNTGDLITLTTVVSDTDNATCALGQTLSVSSEFVGRPAGSDAMLAPAEGLLPAFTADVPGQYVVRTTVDDGTGLSAFTDTTVTVLECGNNPPDALVGVLSPVTVEAAQSIVTPVITTGVPVQLDATSSTDPDTADGCGLNVMLTHSWTMLSLPANSTVAFNDATVENPTFTPDEPGMYEIELAVSDGMYTDYAYATIEVDPSIMLGTSSGHTVEWVAGGTYWNNPGGVAVNASTGDIFVVQSGSDVVTRVSNGVTTYFSPGGYLSDIRDIVYYEPSDSLFVTSNDFDAIIKVDATGAQSLWTDTGETANPRSLDIYTTSSGNAQMLVASENNDRIYFFNPETSANASATGSFTPVDGSNFENPWGVTGAAISGTDTIFATTNNNDGLWRIEGSNEDRLYNRFDNPKDVVYAPSGNLIVADAGRGIVYTVANCSSGTCEVSMLAWGNWEPWGLAFESDTSLLVTDRTGNALYRITGDF